MDFPVAITEAVERGRIHAESLMTDLVRVTRGGGEPTHDEWGNIIPAPSVTVYEGKGKFQHRDPYPSTPDAGESRWTQGVRMVHLPAGITSVQSGDIVECLESRNPRLVGLRVRVRIDGDKTWTTAVRLNVVEVVQHAS